MKIRCLAIDDEPFALRQIADYIRKTQFLELKGECRNAFEAMKLMAEQEIDLLYIDINMPELSGMEFAKSLPEGTGIIFTTAYSEFAVESYRVNAVDYLVKPITYPDFLRASQKAKKIVEERGHISQEEEIETGTVSEHFFVKSEGKHVRINPEDIEYIESLSEYVRFHFSSRSPLMSLMRLKTLEEKLPSDRFMRVHRSYIVNLQKIETVERDRIIFKDKVYIPVSEQYKEAFHRFLDDRHLK